MLNTQSAVNSKKTQGRVTQKQGERLEGYSNKNKRKLKKLEKKNLLKKKIVWRSEFEQK